MTAIIRQWFEVPNSESTAEKVIQGAFGNESFKGGGVRGPTLPGSTIVVFGTYSYDSPNTGACTDTQKQNYGMVNYNADTTPASQGHQNFEAFVLQNSVALSATDEIIFSEPGVDYGGIIVCEITGVPAQSLVGAVSSWQRAITGSSANNLSSGPLSLPPGEYFAIASSVNCTNFGATPPYAPLPGTHMNLVTNWFSDNQLVSDSDIGTLATKEFTLTEPTNFGSTFTTPGSSANDNYVTQLVVLKVGTPAVVHTPFEGTITIGKSQASFSGTLPANVQTNVSNFFAGNLTIDNVSGVFSGTLPAVGIGTPTPPTPVPPTPPVNPTPPGTLPQAGVNVIYNGALEGKELWPGDWSGGGVKENYNDIVNGVRCLTVTALSSYPYWLPFAPLGGPNGNTPTFDPTPYSHLVVIMRPTGENADTLNVGAYTYTVKDGVVTGDVPTGAGVTMNQYAAGSPNEQGFIRYDIPLSALRTVNPLYKIILQDSSTPIGQNFAIEYAAFV